MKLSIVVPIYNGEKTLRKCLDSLINQTYENLEIILVNDGSKDDSLKICEEYQKRDKRIKVISQINQGPSKARENGIKNATGQLIGFLDSDDHVNRDMYEKLVDELEKTDSDISICGYNFNYAGKLVASIGSEKRKFDKELLFQYLKYDFIECMLWNKIFKADLFNNVKHYNYNKGEDLLLCIQLIGNANRMCYLNEPLYNYYVNPNSIMRSKFTLKSLRELEIYDEQLNIFKQKIKNLNKYNDYLIYRKFNCVIRIILNMCESFSFVTQQEILKNLCNQMIDLYDKIDNKKIILPVLKKHYNKIVKYKYMYFVYMYLYNNLRKLKIVIKEMVKFGKK